ncbi:MAG TPA: ClbS/DfsB family four-helix bundle protein [Thermomicrobiales bacterium]|nr:ClbS/DfsB family four-helix bundle protein [Thermomicrobiales bacterium]
MAGQQESRRSVDEALGEIEVAWDRLMGAMTSWLEGDYASIHDAAGWTPIDHLAHVSAWERSRIGWLQGHPRHKGLGVSFNTFAQDYDALNEAVRQQTAGQSYQQVLADARTTHERMLAAIHAFDPSVVDRGGITSEEAARLGDELKENLTDHYEEHRADVEEMLGSN